MDTRATQAKPESRLEQDLQAVSMQLADIQQHVRDLTAKTLQMRSALLGSQPEIAMNGQLMGTAERVAGGIAPARPVVDSLSSQAQAITQDLGALSKVLHSL